MWVLWGKETEEEEVAAVGAVVGKDEEKGRRVGGKLVEVELLAVALADLRRLLAEEELLSPTIARRDLASSAGQRST